MKSLHYFGLVFGCMREKLILIQKSDSSQIAKQFSSGFKACLIALWVEAVKYEYLLDVVADEKLQFDVFMIGTANKAFFIELHELGGQEKPEEGPDASIGFIEPASIKFLIVCCHVEVDLFLPED